jgi:hypothetical protein
VQPDVCFVFSSHQSDDKLRRIPALVKNALKPRALFGRFVLCLSERVRSAVTSHSLTHSLTSGRHSSSFGVFGAGGAMPQGQEVANKQVNQSSLQQDQLIFVDLLTPVNRLVPSHIKALSIVAATMPDVEIYPFHVRTPSLPSFPPGTYSLSLSLCVCRVSCVVCVSCVYRVWLDLLCSPTHSRTVLHFALCCAVSCPVL